MMLRQKDILKGQSDFNEYYEEVSVQVDRFRLFLYTKLNYTC